MQVLCVRCALEVGNLTGESERCSQSGSNRGICEPAPEVSALWELFDEAVKFCGIIV